MSRLPKKTAPKKPARKAAKCTWKDVLDLADVLYVVATINGDAKKLPVGQLPSADISTKCDAWFRHTCAADEHEELSAPPELAPWLAARLVLFTTMLRLMAKHSEDPAHKNIAGDVLVEMLVDMWNSGVFKLWLAFSYGDDDKLHYDPTLLDKIRTSLN